MNIPKFTILLQNELTEVEKSSEQRKGLRIITRTNIQYNTKSASKASLLMTDLFRCHRAKMTVKYYYYYYYY